MSRVGPLTVKDRKKEFDKKITPIERHSEEWERRANSVARSYVVLSSCQKCNSPVIKGCCCTYCGDSSPTMTWEEEAAFEKKYGV